MTRCWPNRMWPCWRKGSRQPYRPLNAELASRNGHGVQPYDRRRHQAAYLAQYRLELFLHGLAHGSGPRAVSLVVPGTVPGRVWFLGVALERVWLRSVARFRF